MPSLDPACDHDIPVLWHKAQDGKLVVHPHDGQLRALENQAKIVMMMAGTGGGKTDFAPIWCLQERERVGRRAPGLIVAPYKILRTTTMPAFLSLAQDALGLGGWESKADGIWRFDGGEEIYFRSADTPESIEGAHVAWCWMDEFGQGQFPAETWWAVQRRVAFHQGRIFGTTTPYVLGWVKELYDEVKRGERDDVEFVGFPSISNPGFSEEEFERRRKVLPPWQFNMFYLAQWDRPAGLIFSGVGEDCWVDALPEGWETWPRYCGIDFGYTAPHANVYGAMDPEGCLWIYDEYYETGNTDSDNARSTDNQVMRAWGDPSSPEAIDEFGRWGWPITACEKHDVKAGIVEVLERVNGGKIRFLRGGAIGNLAKEMDSYVWDDKKPDQPVKLHDHACDALRYMCWGLKNQRRPVRGRPATQRLVLR